MRKLSNLAKAYISATIMVGVLLLLVSIRQLRWENAWMLLVLMTAASISLIFKVEGSTNRSHYNISFLIYAFAFILLGPAETVLIIVVSNLADWIWHRYPWYIQSFNISCYIIGIYLSGLVYRLLNPEGNLSDLYGIISVLAAIAAFTLLNHVMVGIVIWLARGENFSRSGVLAFFPLMLDFTLMAMGAAAGLVWLVNPYAVVLVLLPLYLIYTTLKVPALERQSELDPKTGLFNARYFERALQTELNRANRFDRPLTIVMADLDLLRNINNTYGHLAGDQVLIGVANILKSSVRDYDVVVRFGGEEYAILMPETSPEEAFPRIDTIRQTIEETEFAIPTSVIPIKATMSFGIAGRIGFDQTPGDIVHNADAALYYAKLKGRNGTYVYSEDGFVGFPDEGERFSPPSRLPGDEFRGRQGFSFQPSPLRQVPIVNQAQDEEKEVKPVEKPSAHPRWMVKGYILLVAVFSLGLFSIAAQPVSGNQWLGLGLFALMVVLTEWLSIDIYIRNTAVSTSAAPLLAGVLIYGPIGALVLSLTFAVVAMIKYRSPFSRFVFNFSNQLIAAMLYTLLLQLAGVRFNEIDPVAQLLLCLAFMGLVYFITTSLVTIGMSLDFGQPSRVIWTEKFSWLAPYYLVMGLIAYALVFSYDYAGIFGTMVILVPLLILRFAQVQYINKTRTMVNELKTKNIFLEKGTQEIQRLNEGLLDTQAEVVDLRDPDVLGHSKQVAQYAVMIARKLALPPKQIELVRKAGLLHDIGKLGIAETILFKPELLTPDEYGVVKEHVILGANLLQTCGSLAHLIPIIRHHHEYYNGSG